MPLTQRQMYRRRRIVVFSAVAVVLAMTFYLPLTLLAPLGEVSATILPVEEPVLAEPEISTPSYGASAIGALDRPGVLAQGGSADPVPIASITKIITTLVVLDSKPLQLDEAGPTITFDETDVDFYYDQLAQGGSIAPAYAGQQLSQRDVMTAVLLPSANNYAQSLANWAFGSEGAFVTAANAWLTEHGLTNTTVTEPSGIQETNRSTAADLTELARLAISNPVIAQIVSTSSAEIPGIGSVSNSNKLLGIDGVDGIKTGTLDVGWSCLLFSADVTVGDKVITLVGAVVGGPDHPTINTAIRELIADATAGYTVVTLASDGEEFAEYDTPWGDEAAAVSESTLDAVVWGEDEITATVAPTSMRAADAGESAGTVEFQVGSETFSVPLVLSDDVDDPGVWWRLTNPAAMF
ncbi:D-alanyl-D-alanine carboxypeptidase [Salinibacterium sp. SWN1162]|uniref:D-alanyl-D-alanine carboxypeptidase family protein n=1 Tax=Salinibacterium sp. SWN1162 TaxID=2792053 RepID=UPI0027DE7CF5|nr:D-alanyl-D-alanine carboxypeptidase [Salinibacterium sp. SWN1162]